MKSELQVLPETRELVSTRWISCFNEYAGSYCLVGAINKVTGIPLEATSVSSISRFRRNREVRDLVLNMISDRVDIGCIETWNDVVGQANVLGVLDELIAELEEPKNMEIGKPEKRITVEPAEPVPGIKESPAPTPEPRKEPAKPEREKVPA